MALRPGRLLLSATGLVSLLLCTFVDGGELGLVVIIDKLVDVDMRHIGQGKGRTAQGSWLSLGI